MKKNRHTARDMLTKKVDALLYKLSLECFECNICMGTGKRPGEYYQAEGGQCFECGGVGIVLGEVYE